MVERNLPRLLIRFFPSFPETLKKNYRLCRTDWQFSHLWYKSINRRMHHSQCLLEALFECSANCHYLPNTLHWTTNLFGRHVKAIQVPSRNLRMKVNMIWIRFFPAEFSRVIAKHHTAQQEYLSDNVVQTWFETSCGLLCCWILYIRQLYSKRELSGNERQRISGKTQQAEMFIRIRTLEIKQ